MKAIAVVRTIVIYALFDSADLAMPRYVGQTNCVRRRLVQHLKDVTRGHKASWIRSVVDAGRHIEQRVLAYAVSKRDADTLERRFIKRYRASGYHLTNITDGGEGTSGRRSTPSQRLHGNTVKVNWEIVRQIRTLANYGALTGNIAAMFGLSKGNTRKIVEGRYWPEDEDAQGFCEYVPSRELLERLRTRADVWTGRHHTESARLKMSVAHKGKQQSAESVEKRAMKLRGRRWTSKKIGDALRGKPKSAAHRAALSASLKASPVAMERMKDLLLLATKANTGKKQSVATIAKRTATLRSDAVRAKISDASKRMWGKRREWAQKLSQ